jgi:hypothetical protein
MAKYTPLESYLLLADQKLDEIVLSFAQIEQIIGATLPPDAYNPSGTWWRNTNDAKRPQAKAWLNAGWKIAASNQAGKQVRFVRQ